MAKIALVSEHLSPTANQLAQALKSQAHEVIFLTSADENIESTGDLQYLTYFKDWSWKEGIKFLPALWSHQPQILHFILPEDKLNGAQMVLWAYAQTLPNCILTVTLLNIRKGLNRRNPVRYLLQESDIITCPSVETLAHLRGLNIRSRRQGRGILPPVLNFTQAADKLEQWHETSHFIEDFKNKKYVVVPFSEPKFVPSKHFFQRLSLLSRHYFVILLGSHQQWSLRERKRFQSWMDKQGLGSQWWITGNLSLSLQQQLLAKSEAFILAGLKLSPIEITEYYLRAIRTDTTLIIDSKQASIHAGLWQNEKNCWILEFTHLTEKLQSLMAGTSLKLNEKISDLIVEQRDLIDAPLNDLNRLYQRALAQN